MKRTPGNFKAGKKLQRSLGSRAKQICAIYIVRARSLIRGRIALVADFGEHVDQEMEDVKKDIEQLLFLIKDRRRKVRFERFWHSSPEHQKT